MSSSIGLAFQTAFLTFLGLVSLWIALFLVSTILYFNTSNYVENAILYGAVENTQECNEVLPNDSYYCVINPKGDDVNSREYYEGEPIQPSDTEVEYNLYYDMLGSGYPGPGDNPYPGDEPMSDNPASKLMPNISHSFKLLRRT